MVKRRLSPEFWSRHGSGVRRSPVQACFQVERMDYTCERKRARSEAFRAVTGDGKEVVNMKQLMGASVVGESGPEILYWSGGFGFLLCEEVEPGFWKVEALAREEARHWCEVRLTPAEYRDIFGAA